MKKLLPLLFVLCGCGTLWDWVGFGNPFPSAEEQIAEKCVDASQWPEVQAGLKGVGLDGTGQKVYVCQDILFEDRQEDARNYLCTVGHDWFILIRQLAPQYVCQCAFHEGYHVLTGDLYNNNEMDNAKMSETCKDFSLELPEPHSYLAD